MSFQNYQIGKKLGEGAFGSVCIVTNKTDKKLYAMKSVKMSKLDLKEKQNALNEIRYLYSLNHKNIIGYKDAFYDDSSKTLNIIMELADDGDIAGKIKQIKNKKLKFDENTIWKILIQLIQGLKYLHDNNIIHRDLKSANIFLMKNGLIKTYQNYQMEWQKLKLEHHIMLPLKFGLINHMIIKLIYGVLVVLFMKCVHYFLHLEVLV